MNDRNEHYFTGSPRSHGLRHAYTFTVNNDTFDIHTDAGIFSGDRLDKGTAVLLDAYRAGKLVLPTELHGDVIDLGCGAGPLALVLAHHYTSAQVWAVDVNDQAVQACRHNARINNCPNVVAGSPDYVPSDTRFSVLWSNPPIRIGKEQLHSLMITWLSRLAPDGVAHVVINKNLGGDSFAAWLTAQHFRVSRVASSKGFRVLEITR
jgi:16S rRNA (guanine1207-N2)-methyltransferase